MSKPQRKIIDSHVHLWPLETANEDGHTWMPPGMPIAKAQLPADYLAATKSDGQGSNVHGLVFIETDIRYETSEDDIPVWAKGPLDEITFIRRIVDGEYGPEANRLLVAIVPWAPIDQETTVFQQYLDLAESRAGEATWTRIKGFRFLLQAILEEEKFQSLVFSKGFIDNLRLLGRRGLSFDVGADQRSGGIWQLELMAEAMKLAHDSVKEDEKVVFIINHLCKPDFADTGVGFERWCEAIASMAKLSKTYMKLSGAFSELSPFLGSSDPKEIAIRLKPWLVHTFRSFGPERIMFGSDWPVCNLNGPRGEDSWVAWKDVIDAVVEDSDYDLSGADQDHLWHETAEKAYRLTLSRSV